MNTVKIKKVGQSVFSTVDKKDFFGAINSGYISGVNDVIEIKGVMYSLSSADFNASGLTSATLNLSDSTIYDAATGILTISPAALLFDILNLTVDLYDPAGIYKVDSIVKSDGTNGGVNGKSYKSITPVNSGNLLSDIANWVFADATIAGPGIGNILIDSISNLPADMVSSFREDGTFTTTYVSGGSTPAAGQFFLDLNTDVSISNPYSQISFINISGVSVKQLAPLQ